MNTAKGIMQRQPKNYSFSKNKPNRKKICGVLLLTDGVPNNIAANLSTSTVFLLATNMEKVLKYVQVLISDFFNSNRSN